MTEQHEPDPLVQQAKIEHVLVVDSHRPVQRLFRHVLSTQPCIITEASTEKDAITLIQASAFDLMFLAISLSDGNGVEVLREARARQPDLKIILLTGRRDAQEALSALKLGAVGYLIKPLNLGEVQNVIRRYLLAGIVQVGHDALLLGSTFADVVSTLPDAQILVVSNREHLLSFIEELMSQAGCKVAVAVSVQQARDAFEQSHYELVIADVDTAGENGIDFLKWAQKYHPDTEVILTGYPPSQEVALQALYYGASSFIVRPFLSLNDFINVVSRALKKNVIFRNHKAVNEVLKRQHIELQLLYKVSNAISYTISYEVLINIIMESLVEVIPYDVAASLIVIPERSLSVYPNGEIPDEYTDRCKQHAIKSFEALTDQTVPPESCKEHLIRMKATSPWDMGSAEQAPASEEQIFFNVPIFVCGRLIGMISMSSVRGYLFQEHDVRLVSTVIHQMSGAIERVREIVTGEQNKMETMVKNMAEGVIMLDEKDVVTVINPQAKLLLDFKGKREETDIQLAHLPRLWGFEALVQKIKSGSKTSNCDIEIGIGNLTTIRVQASPVLNAEGRQRGVVIVLRDITREKEVMRMKDKFVSTVSHELRTPLTAIKEGVSLMVDGVLGPVSAEQQKFLGIVDGNVKRLTGLISDLLELSKIEAGHMRTVRKKVSVEELVKTLLTSYGPIARGRTIQCEVSPVHDVYADSKQIIQVLANLFSNAVKFTKDNGTITFSSQEQGGVIAVSVRDDGIGIAKQDISLLFKRFSRVGRDHQRPGGTGLGLAVSKELIELHQGTLSVDSELGKGSCFTFTLPVYTPELTISDRFQRLVRLSVKRHMETISLVAIDCRSLPLEQVFKLIEKNVHSDDEVMTYEPGWILIMAITDGAGQQSMVERLGGILDLWAKTQKELFAGPGVRMGTALYPKDAEDARGLFAKATAFCEGPKEHIPKSARRKTA